MTAKPNVKKAVDKAIKLVGLKQLAGELKISYQAMRGWQDKNRMPDTEFSGRTKHSLKIHKLTDGTVSVDMLLGHEPLAIAVELEKLKAKINANK